MNEFCFNGWLNNEANAPRVDTVLADNIDDYEKGYGYWAFLIKLMQIIIKQMISKNHIALEQCNMIFTYHTTNNWISFTKS